MARVLGRMAVKGLAFPTATPLSFCVVSFPSPKYNERKRYSMAGQYGKRKGEICRTNRRRKS